MSLFKKTFVFSGQPPKGFLTVLKIGGTCGIKLTLNTVSPNMTLAVKIGAGHAEAFQIRALKEEFRVAEEFDEKTVISAVVFQDGAVYAHTGATPSVQYNEIVSDKDSKTSNTESETSKYSQTAATKGAEKSSARGDQPPRSGAVYYESVVEQERKAKKNASAKAEPAEAEVVSNGESFGFFKKQADDHFYDRVRGRMDEMFVVHPREQSLETMIPDSKWVRVPYSQDEFYVVGILADGERVTHIGYGVKGLRSVFPPKEAEALSEFLPTQGDEGYWLMFQDAQTGEMLPID